MTAEQTAAPIKPPKPAWTRCPKCKDRIFNDRIDIEVHGQHCPADLQRALRRAVRDLEKRIDELEKRPEPVFAELVIPEPALDFEHEAPWPADATPALPIAGPEDDDEDELPEVPDFVAMEPPARLPITRASRYDDDDDEDDD